MISVQRARTIVRERRVEVEQLSLDLFDGDFLFWGNSVACELPPSHPIFRKPIHLFYTEEEAARYAIRTPFANKTVQVCLDDALARAVRSGQPGIQLLEWMESERTWLVINEWTVRPTGF